MKQENRKNCTLSLVVYFFYRRCCWSNIEHTQIQNKSFGKKSANMCLCIQFINNRIVNVAFFLKRTFVLWIKIRWTLCWRFVFLFRISEACMPCIRMFFLFLFHETRISNYIPINTFQCWRTASCLFI